MRCVVVLLVLLVLQNAGWTQSSNNSIYLHNSASPSTLSTAKNLPTSVWPSNNCGSDGCFAIIQFLDMPQEAERATLSDMGITLYDYVPNLAFLALYSGSGLLDLPDFVVQVIPLEGQNKRAEGPLSIADGAEGGDVYDLIATPFQMVPVAALAGALQDIGATITKVGVAQVHIQIPVDLLSEIQTCPLLRFIEPAQGEATPEGITSSDNIRVTDLRTHSGLLLDGTNVQIGIQDDGRLNHIDFLGRYYDRANIETGDHGDMVAGMAAGGGWLNPIGRGAAPGASVHMFYINDNLLLTKAIENYERYGIVLTNTSYGFDCGVGYRSIAANLDAQVNSQPAILHCFSAGNQGQNSCFNQYGALGSTSRGTYWGNITGSEKSAKNVVAVGNVGWDDRVLLSSSRGPTPSGRIKPDMVGQGQGDWTTDRNNGYRISSGTSAASPNVLGGFAVLYQGYRLLNNGRNPSSALMKALALNTADDLGPLGPDYRYGWGRMNVAKAWESVENEQYFNNAIRHGQVQTFNLSIPANAEQVRVMVYWHDAPASTLASRDLVNDLDMRMIAPNGQGRLPWAPSTVPHLDSLNKAALPRIDRVNNMEQIVWDNPVAGNYTIEIKGHQIPSNNQEYYVVYYVETEPLTWRSPNAGDALVAGESVVLNWEATKTNLSFQVEYSLNGGQSWQTIATNVPAERRSIRWQVPNLHTANLKFRVLRGGQQAYSEDQAVIGQQLNFTVQGLNPQFAIIEWQSVPGAIAYDVFQLGATKMVRMDRVSNRSYTVPVVSGESYWFSVAPVFAGDLVGRRAIAQNYVHTACTQQVRLQLNFDAHPEQTSWRILDNLGNTLESGGPYATQAPNSSLELTFCLPEGCHTLVMQDAVGNGMCCQNGNGAYRLLDMQGTNLVEGGNFGSFRPQLFCSEGGSSADPLAANAEIVRPVSCAGQSDGVLRVTASGGTGNYQYFWSNGARSAQLQNATAGNYAVTVDDGSQAVAMTINLASPEPLLLAASTTPALCSDGTLVALPQGGTPPYDLQWNTGQQSTTLVGLPGGEYFGLLTDANGCVGTGRFSVGAITPLALSLDVTQPSCTAPNGGQIRAQLSGGRGEVTLQWNTGQAGGNTLTGLSNGNYAVTAVDGGCQVTASAQLTSPEVFDLIVNAVDPGCAGANNGQIRVQPNGGVGPYSYVWNGTVAGSFRSGLSAGSYQIRVIDAMGCQATVVQNLSAPQPINLNSSVTPATGTNNGSIQIDIDGGTRPYTVNWGHTTSTANSLTNLGPGVYQLTVLDEKGCSASLSVTVPWINPNTPVVYCPAQGINTNYEWIEGIELNGLYYGTGNDGGYGDHSTFVFNLEQGAFHNMILTPGYSATKYREAWRIWIDWDRDGDFNGPNEQVLQHGPVSQQTQTQLYIQPDAPSGDYRMRIAMQYAAPAAPCSNVSYGEIEDYTVRILSSPQNIGELPPTETNKAKAFSASADLSVKLWPNPTTDYAQVKVNDLEIEALSYELRDMHGRLLVAEELAISKSQIFKVSMSTYPAGVYYLQLQSGDRYVIKRLVKR